MIQVHSLTFAHELYDFPKKCPHCHYAINPNILYAHQNQSGGDLEVFVSCPNDGCEKSFIAYYNLDWRENRNHYTGKTSFGTIVKKQFSEHIEKISPKFSLIYNQAYFAEQQDLEQICGVGYRKSLEFLIKDYAISLHPTEQVEIEKKPLAKCIDMYVTDKIKSVAKRATWLGNDETHYVKKWETKDIDDLKKLIDLTLHWIEMEYLTDSFEQEMPD